MDHNSAWSTPAIRTLFLRAVFVMGACFFPLVVSADLSISGTLLQSDGVSARGAGITVGAAVGTSSISRHTTTTNASGVFTIDIIDPVGLSSTTPISLFVEGATTTSAASTLIYGVDIGGGTSTLSGADIRTGWFTMNNATGSQEIDLANADQPDSSFDPDILFTVTSGTTTILTDLQIATGTTLRAPDVLVLNGGISNQGTFDERTGLVIGLGSGANFGVDIVSTSTITSFAVNGGEGIQFSSTGNELFYLTSTGVFVFEMSPPGDVSTLTFNPAKSFTPTNINNLSGIVMSADGTKMILSSWGSAIFAEYTLSTPFDPSTASFVRTAATVAATEPIAANNDGTKLYAAGAGGVIQEYSLSTPYDLSTMTTGSTSAAAIGLNLMFNADGSRLIVQNNEILNEYSLSTPFDIATLSLVDSFDTNGYLNSATYGGTVSPDFSTLYFVRSGVVGLLSLSEAVEQVSYAGVSSFADLTITSANVLFPDPSVTFGSLSVGFGGAVAMPASTTISGNLANAGVYTGASTTNFISNSALSISGVTVFNDVFIAGAGEKTFLSDAIFQDLTLATSSGTTTLATSTVVTGDFIANAPLDANGGSFALAGADQFFSNNATTTFNNFVLLPSGTATVTFAVGTRILVEGSMTIDGGVNAALTLQSASPGLAWFLAASGQAGVSRATIIDSTYIGTPSLFCTLCVDGGGNTNWRFTADLEGQVFIDRGVTGASGVAVDVIVGTSTPGLFRATTSPIGTWALPEIDISTLPADTPVLISVDSGGVNANTFVQGLGDVDRVTGILTYDEFLIAYGATTTSVVDITDFDFYDSDVSSSSLFTVDGSTTTLQRHFILVQGEFLAPLNGELIANDSFEKAAASVSTFTANGATVRIQPGDEAFVSGLFTGNNAFADLVIDADNNLEFLNTASSTNVTVLETDGTPARLNYTGTKTRVDGNPNRTAWNGDYLAVAHSGGNNLSFYRNDVTGLTKLANPTNPGTFMSSVEWNGDFLVTGGGGGTMRFYQRSGDTLTQLANPANASGTVQNLAWGGNYLAVGSDGVNSLSLYRRDGNVLTGIANPTSPASTVIGLDWFGNFLAVADLGTGVSLYERVGDGLVLRSTTTTGGGAISAAWNDAGDHLLVGDVNGRVTLFSRSSTTLTQTGQQFQLTGFPFDIHAEGDTFLVADDTGTSNVEIFRNVGGSLVRVFDYASLTDVLGSFQTRSISYNGEFIALTDLIADDVSIHRLVPGALTIPAGRGLSVAGDFVNEGAGMEIDGILFLNGADNVVRVTATSAVDRMELGNVLLAGDYEFYGVASTTDLGVAPGAFLRASNTPFTIARGFENNGSVDWSASTQYLVGEDGPIDGNLIGANAFGDVILLETVTKTLFSNASVTDLRILGSETPDVPRYRGQQNPVRFNNEFTFGPAWHEDGVYGVAPFIDITQVGEDTGFHFIQRLGDGTVVELPDPTPVNPGGGGGAVYEAAWGGDYVVIGHEGGNNLSFYRLDGDQLTKLTNPQNPGARVTSVEWFRDEYVLVASYGGNSLSLYKRDGDTLTFLDSAGSGQHFDIGVNEDGYVAVAVRTSSPFFQLFKIDTVNDQLIRLEDPIDQRGSSKFSASFSGDYITIGGAGGPYLYKLIDEKAVFLEQFDNYRSDGADASGDFFALYNADTDEMHIYQRFGDSLVQIYETFDHVAGWRPRWFEDELWFGTNLGQVHVIELPRSVLSASGTQQITVGGDLVVNGRIENSGTLYLEGNEANLILDSNLARKYDRDIGNVALVGSYTATGTLATRDFTLFSGATATNTGDAFFEGDFLNQGTYSAGSATNTLWGDFDNQGTFNASSSLFLFASTTGQQIATGTLTGVNAFNRLAIHNASQDGATTQSVVFGAPVESTDTFSMIASTSASFLAGATATFQNVEWQSDSSDRPVWLRSSNPGTEWVLDIPGNQLSINYVDVSDSDASSVPGGVSAIESTNSGNNTNWNFGDTDQRPTLQSVANQRFVVGQGSQLIEPIVYTEAASSSFLYARTETDLRITIDTANVDMRWDTSDTSATIEGASNKVSSSVTYEDAGATLVIDVVRDFQPLDSITISGLSFTNFGSTNVATTALSVNGANPPSVSVAAVATSTVEIVDAARVWNDVNWPNYVSLTIDHTVVDQDLTDFPVYVNLADLPSTFWNIVRDDGGDIRVTTDGGSPTELAREVAYISTSTETGELYFKAPLISSTTDTTFRIYFNGVDADYLPGEANGVWDVWTNGYVAVFHLTEDANVNRDNFKDSTSNQNHATLFNSTVNITVASKLGRGVDLDGSNDHLEWRRAGLPGGTSPRTISVWADTDTISGGTDYAFGYGDNRDQEGFAIRQSNGDLQGWWNSGTVSEAGFWAAGTYGYSAFTYDGTDVVLYGSGVAVSSSTIALATDNGLGSFIGARPDDDADNWDGIIDEARVSDVVRSAAWISAEHLNQATSTDFYSVSLGVGSTTLRLSSAANQSFEIGAGPVAISEITITDATPTSTISAADDIRIVIATSTVAMEWDTTDTTAVLGGSAAGKVSTTVSYEGAGSVLVLDVASDFTAGDTLTVSGLSFTNFTGFNSASTALSLRVDGPSDSLDDATDDKTITILGAGTVGTWNDTGWTMFDTITIDAANIDEDLTDFPVYVNLADLTSQFWSTVAADGSDIRVTTGTSSPYEVPHELVSIDTGTDTGELHFKAPLISSTTDTVFRVYYNGVTQTPYASSDTYGAENVWTNGFAAVYHMDDDPSGVSPQVIDSTGNGFDGTTEGAMTTGDVVAGQLGDATDFDGSNDAVDTGNSTQYSAGNFTVSSWIRPDDVTTAGQRIITDDASSQGWSLSLGDPGSGGLRFFVRGMAGESLDATSVIAQGLWHHTVGVFDNSSDQRFIYVNGSVAASNLSDTGTPSTDAGNVRIGQSSGTYFDGLMDHVRISSVARSAAWISAEYLNQSTTTDFYTAGVGTSVLPWNASDWTLYDTVTIDAANIDDDLTDFPVYVDLNDLSATFWSTTPGAANLVGTDIRVTTDDGTPVELPRELVFASSTAETGELHFKANLISSTTDTVFRIWYNGSTAGDYATSSTYGAANVWSDYAAVYHFNEDPSGGVGAVLDSTANANHGTASGTMTTSDLVASHMGTGLEFDGADDFIIVPDSSSLDINGTSITVSAWYDYVSNGPFQILLGKVEENATHTAPFFSYALQVINTDDPAFLLGDSSGDGFDRTSISNGALTRPQLYTVSFDGSDARLYLDATEGESLARTDSVRLTNGDLYLGSNGAGGEVLQGVLDEVRISSSSRSAAWISAEHLNQSTTTDFYTINLTPTNGSTTITDHTATQVENAFSFQNVTDGELFAFRLVPESGTATITETVITLSGANKIDPADFSNFRLLKDHDNDAQYDATDEPVGGAGVMTLTGRNGSITFSGDFLSTTTTNYLVVADWNHPENGALLRLDLLTSGLTATDENGGQLIFGAVDDIQHNRAASFGGGGGSSAAIAAPVVVANPPQSGGGSAGGGEAGQQPDGENIADDPDFKKPSSTGDPDNDWTNPENAFESDGVRASFDNPFFDELRQSYGGFNYGIPVGNEIVGIEVKVDGRLTGGGAPLHVRLSWDGGTTTTSYGLATANLNPGSDTVLRFGGPSFLWGRSWTPEEFSDTNFRVIVSSFWEPVMEGILEAEIDAIQVKVYHQATGGSAGGGGAI